MKSSDMETQIIPTVNYHCTKSCNFHCKYCFAHFNDVCGQQLSEFDSLNLIKKLAECGYFTKINFAGGEPMLVPHLDKLIKTAKEYGMKTSIVTNGSRLSPEWIKQVSEHLDIIAISVDSINVNTNNNIGKKTLLENLTQLIRTIHDENIKLKINTVVSAYNKEETLTSFINEAMPFKWKILQATKIIGQNEADFSKVAVSEKDYKSFCDRNGEMLSPDIEIVCESENAIIGSYCMIDHRGCFFDDSSGQHRYSDPILKIGVEKALQQTVYSFDKFNERKGNY